MPTESGPTPYPGGLPPAEHPLLHGYIQDIAQWVLKESVGESLTPDRCDDLAAELAAILTGGLAPSLAAEIEHDTQKAIAAAQTGPVTLDRRGRLKITGLDTDEVARLIDAVGQLMSNGVGEPLDLLHSSHRSALSTAHDAWLSARRSSSSPD
ncbi:MAG TPA: hypothetical protein VFN97_08735 [Actinospica sp.]|nr:hypothetical protein [Actinospica sp.]